MHQQLTPAIYVRDYTITLLVQKNGYLPGKGNYEAPERCTKRISNFIVGIQESRQTNRIRIYAAHSMVGGVTSRRDI